MLAVLGTQNGYAIRRRKSAPPLRVFHSLVTMHHCMDASAHGPVRVASRYIVRRGKEREGEREVTVLEFPDEMERFRERRCLERPAAFSCVVFSLNGNMRIFCAFRLTAISFIREGVEGKD